MAKLVGAYGMSHSMYCHVPVERWSTFYTLRRQACEDVPQDTPEKSRSKTGRTRKALAMLRAQVVAARPDVLVVFGDDQLECFDCRNMPAFAIYAGARYLGYDTRAFLARSNQGSPIVGPQREGPSGTRDGVVQGIDGTGVRSGLLHGNAQARYRHRPCVHAAGRVAGRFCDPRAAGAVQLLFRAPTHRNALLSAGTGGARSDRAVPAGLEGGHRRLRRPLAHAGTGQALHRSRVRSPDAGAAASGNARGMSEYFDRYRVPEGGVSQDTSKPGRFSNGVPGCGGPQGGTRELCNWTAAASVFEGRPWTVLDYVPVYASPIGMGFAYCTAS